MDKYLKTSNIFYKISKIAAAISMGAMFFIALLTTIDVVVRLLSKVTPMEVYVRGTFEITQLFLILIVFLGYAATEWEHGHVNVNIISAKLPRVPKQVLQIIVYIIMVIFAFFLVAGAAGQVQTCIAGKVTSSVLFIPYAPFAVFMTIGYLLLLIAMIFNLINEIITLKRGNEEWNTLLPK